MNLNLLNQIGIESVHTYCIRRYTSIIVVCYCTNTDRDNITVQERLFDRMDDLLQLDVAIPEMADLLSEVSYQCCTAYVIYGITR